MTDKTPIAGILLAAGMSKRFGSLKQLAQLDSKPLIRIALAAALNSNLDHVFLVLGHEYDKVQAAIDSFAANPRLTIIRNPEYYKGMSTSVKAAVTRIQKDYGSAMFLLADQPMISAAFINLLIDAHTVSSRQICVPVKNNRPGNPVIFSRHFFPDLLTAQGDRGGRDIVKKNPDQVQKVFTQNKSCVLDIDTPEDLRQMSAYFSSPSSRI